MARRISKRDAAFRDLEETGQFVGRDSLDAELRFYNAARQTFERIAEMPLIGRERSELTQERLPGLRSFRILGFENWLVFYLPTSQGIDVVRVLHGARDLGTILEDER